MKGGVFGEPPDRRASGEGRREVVFPNVFGFTRTFMDAKFSCAHRAAWSAGTMGISECSLFWGGPDKTVLLPLEADPLWVSDVRECMGYSRLETLHLPSRGVFSGELRERLAGADRKAKLLPWGASEDFYSLAEFLGRERFFIEGEVTPGNRFYEAVNLDSKAGFRLAASGRVRMPGGFVAQGLREALAILPSFMAGGGGVLKANHGTGGISVALFPAGGFSPGAAKKTMEARARWDPFWLQRPVVVEELVSRGETAPAPVTADFFIGEDEGVRFAGAGLMRIAAGTRYSGLVAGKGALGDEILAEVLKAGESTGKILAERGVRGWFNVDFVADKEDKLYAAEVNVRRSMAAHLLDAAKFLYGEGWEKRRAFLANDHLVFTGKRPGYGRLRSGFSAYNKEARCRGAWAVPTSVNGGLRRNPPRISFILTAKDAKSLPGEEAALIARLERETENRCTSPPFPEPWP